MAIGVIANDEKNKLISDKLDNKYFDEEIYEILDTKNTNESRSIICSHIKENCIVLDIGCASGVIGKYLKENKNCIVYGIELDQKAIQLAEKTNCYKALYNFNISEKDNKEYQDFFNKNIKFDYILFSDVLEHLINPAEVLYQFGKLLNDNGEILISIPNIAHYDVVHGLLNEKFNYSDMGILDNTHLRFFTKKSFAEYIETANKKYNKNYDLEQIGKTIIKPYFYGKYEKLDSIIEKNENLFVLQNIFSCKKVKKEEEPIHLNELLSIENKDLADEINNQFKKYEKDIDLLEQKLKNEKDILNNRIEALEKKNHQDEEQIEELEKIKFQNEEKINELVLDQRDLIDYNKSLINQINSITNSKSWKYTQFIRDYKLKKQKKKSRLNIVNNRESILFFIHSWININDSSSTNIGGTTLHLLDVINNIKNDINCYVLTVINNNYCLVVFDNNTQKIYDLHLRARIKYFDKYDFDFINLVLELIDNLKIDMIHIQHFINFPCDLQFLPKKIKTIVTVHDYFLKCPKFELVNYENKLCINGKKLDCKKCTKLMNIDIETRNIATKNLLSNANTVIVPDESVAKELSYFIKTNNIKVIPHGINIESFLKYSKSKKNNSKNKNIAIVGVLTEHKGENIVKDLILNNKDKNITYHFFGTTVNSYLNESHEEKNYVCHGSYKQNELPKLLNENNIDLVLLTSILPETFSYTLSETLFAKIPCVSYNLGAMANRIKKENVGWVLDKQANFKYTDFTSKYSEIFDKNNYNKVMQNIKKHKNKDIPEMVSELMEFYKIDNCKTKNYDDINDYLEKYGIKYII